MRWNKTHIHTLLIIELYRLIGPNQVGLSYDKDTNLIKLDIFQESGVMTLKYASRTAQPWSAKNAFRILEDLKRTFK